MDGQTQATTKPLRPERSRGKKPFGLKGQRVETKMGYLIYKGCDAKYTVLSN